MDGLIDIADAWMTHEKQRQEKEREVGRAWLSLMVEGDPDKMGAVVTDLAERTGLHDFEVRVKLQASATAYMQHVTAAAHHRISRPTDGGCGCNSGEGERRAPVTGL